MNFACTCVWTHLPMVRALAPGDKGIRSHVRRHSHREGLVVEPFLPRPAADREAVTRLVRDSSTAHVDAVPTPAHTF